MSRNDEQRLAERLRDARARHDDSWYRARRYDTRGFDVGDAVWNDPSFNLLRDLDHMRSRLLFRASRWQIFLTRLDIERKQLLGVDESEVGLAASLVASHQERRI